MKTAVPALLLLMTCFNVRSQQVDGATIFATNCAACHTIGKGNLVGPDLKGVTDRYEKTWISRFIRESQAMVAEGDEKAVAAFEANNMIPMPNVPLNDAEIDALLAHISGVGSAAKPDPPKRQPTVESVPKPTSGFTSGVSEEQRDATFKSMMTGFWIAFGAFTIMGIGIWYSTRNH